MWSKEDLVKHIKELGIKKGDLLNLKVSMRSIGQIEGGAFTLIEAFKEAVGDNGTIITDSFVKAFPYPFSRTNKKRLSSSDTKSYAGVFANEMISHPGALRSPHAIQKFVGIGKLAEELIPNHINSSFPYNVLYQMTKLGGKNIRIGDFDKVIGVGTTHVAICLLGFKQNCRKAGVNYIDNGILKPFIINWPDGCPKGFNNLIPRYHKIGAVLAEGKIGNAEALVTDMHKTLDYELQLGKEDPKFFMCNDPTCYKCRITWKQSTDSKIATIINCIKSRKFKNIAAIVYLSFHKNYLPK